MAKKRIKPYIFETPLQYSNHYSKVVGGDVYLKLENLQLTGSFKIRGVINKILKKRIFDKPWVAASAGNHGKALAYAAQLFRNKCIIYVPREAPNNKKNAIKMYGAELIEVDGVYDDAEAAAKECASKADAIYISPYNDVDIIYGQGTIALEIIDTDPNIDEVVVPVGGGGLISGIAITLKKINPRIKVVGVQSTASPSMYESIKRGRITRVKLKESIADGLHGNIEPGSITFDIIRKLVDEIVLVDEEDIYRGIVEMVKYHGLIVEGAAATTLAAITKYKKKFRYKKICVIITGRNIDYNTLVNILTRY